MTISTSIHDAIAELEAKFKAEFEAIMNAFRSHPAVQAAASSPTPAPSNPAPTPTAPAAPQAIDPHNLGFWHQWVGQSDRVAFTEAAMKLGRALTQEEMGVAYLAGVVHSDQAQPAAGGDGWVDKSDLYGHSGGEESCARNSFQPGVERVVVLHPDTDSLALYWSDSNVANSSVVSCFITDASGNVICPDKPPEQRENTHAGVRGPVPCTPGAAYPAHITLDRGGSMDLVLRDK